MKDKPPPDADDQKIGTRPPADESSAGPILPHCGDFEMRIARDGTWYHQGSPIGRKSLVKLFSSVLRRDADGVYWLQTPVEKGRILVEDAPFTVVECQTDGAGRQQVLRFRTNLDEWFEVDAEHPIRVQIDDESGEPRPYVVVRDRLEALILRPVYYDLVELSVAEGDQESGAVGVWSNGAFFRLG